MRQEQNLRRAVRRILAEGETSTNESPEALIAKLSESDPEGWGRFENDFKKMFTSREITETSTFAVEYIMDRIDDVAKQKLFKWYQKTPRTGNQSDILTSILDATYWPGRAGGLSDASLEALKSGLANAVKQLPPGS